MAEVSVKTFAVADLDDYLELSQSEYGPLGITSPAHIRWKHLDSPFGASTYIRLVASGKIIGRALLQPRPMHTASKEFNAACVTDVLIGREFRSPPTNFINVTKASGNVSKFDLVYHTSNERTEQLYSKLLRFPRPFFLKAYGFPLRLAGFLPVISGRRIDVFDWLIAPLRWLLGIISLAVDSATRLDISPRAMGDEELAALCTKCIHQSGPLFARTNAFLKWRFTDAPFWPATTYRVDRDGKFLGYIVIRKLELNGLSHLVLMDFVLDPETPLFVRLALRLWLIRSAIRLKVDVLYTMVNSVNSIARMFAGFPLVGIPDRLLPHATPIFVRRQNNDNSEPETDRLIHLTLADLDYF